MSDSNQTLVQNDNKNKQSLRTALIENHRCGRWCSIIRSDSTDNNNKGELVRLLNYNNGYYSFITFPLNEETLVPDTYLLHESEFLVKWTKEAGCEDESHEDDELLHGCGLENGYISMFRENVCDEDTSTTTEEAISTTTEEDTSTTTEEAISTTSKGDTASGTNEEDKIKRD